MTKFAVGSAMGMLLGAGLMMMPVGKELRRDARKTAVKVKRWMKSI